MADDHWFDTLHRVLIERASRRKIVRSAVAFAVGLLFGEGQDAATAKKKRRKKGKKKIARCGHTECGAYFTGHDLDYCQVKCGRCRIREKFCVIEGHGEEDHPGWHATCCHETQQCCGYECCGPNDTCCETKDGRECIRGRVECCVSDSTLGYCVADETCCPGIGCVTGTCENPCPTGLRDCGGVCRECCLRPLP
jgi:hypothetical protein